MARPWRRWSSELWRRLRCWPRARPRAAPACPLAPRPACHSPPPDPTRANERTAPSSGTAAAPLCRAAYTCCCPHHATYSLLTVRPPRVPPASVPHCTALHPARCLAFRRPPTRCRRASLRQLSPPWALCNSTLVEVEVGVQASGSTRDVRCRRRRRPSTCCGLRGACLASITMDLEAQVQQLLALAPAEAQQERHAKVGERERSAEGRLRNEFALRRACA